MAQITVSEKVGGSALAVKRVRQAVGLTFYADIAERLYNASHVDLFADLSDESGIRMWTT